MAALPTKARAIIRAFNGHPKRPLAPRRVENEAHCHVVYRDWFTLKSRGCIAPGFYVHECSALEYPPGGSLSATKGSTTLPSGLMAKSDDHLTHITITLGLGRIAQRSGCDQIALHLPHRTSIVENADIGRQRFCRIGAYCRRRLGTKNDHKA